MLGAALVFVTLFRQLRLGATLGYIVAGALIGPQLLGLIKRPGAAHQRHRDRHRAAAVHRRAGASAEPVVADAADIFGLGLVQVVLCGLAISALLYLALGISPEAALAIGLPLGLSSTAQVLPMLRADNELNTPQGERAFSILLFQDLSIVPMITIIAAMARTPPDPCAPVGWKLGALHRRCGCRAGVRRPPDPQPAVPPGRAGLASASCSWSPACSRSSARPR